MYVLVLIMSFQGDVRVQSFPSLFPTWETCTQVSQNMRQRLMSTRPAPDATVNTYCFQIPESI